MVDPPKVISVFPKTGKNPLPGIEGTAYKRVESPKGTRLANQKPSIQWEKLEPILKKVQEETGSRYVGFYSVSDSSEGIYYYATSPLSFSPEALKQAKGKMESFLYETRRNGKNAPTQLLAAFIPNSKLAKREMVQWLFSKMRQSPASAYSREVVSVLATKICYIVIGWYKKSEPNDIHWSLMEVPCENSGETTPENPGSDPPYPKGGPDNDPGGPDVPCERQPIPTDECEAQQCTPPYRCGKGPSGPSGPEEPCKTSVVQLKNTFPDAPERILEEIVGFINEYAEIFGIDTEEEMQHFLAQAGHESGDWKGDPFSAFEENLNYRVQRLGEEDYWENYFNTAENPTADPNKANPFDYAQYPDSKYVDHEKFANYVYDDANRPPNYKLGNTAPGDGYKYRGRGIFQLTGKDNYSQFNAFYTNNYDNTVNLLENPDLITNNKEIAVISALWFFKENVLGDDGELEENASVESVTEKVNGGDNGLDDRKQLFNQTKTYINCL